MTTNTFRVMTGAATLATGLLFSSPTIAQRGRGQGMPMYDTATEVTLAGTVERVITMDAMAGRDGRGRGMGMGMGGTHVMLKTDQETIEVHLGPSAFLKEQHLEIAAGDAIEVVGSRVTMHDSQAVLAREVRKQDRSWALRDADGRPEWSMMGAR